MAGRALAVSIASLLVAIGAVALSWYLWRRSGPEIVVLIYAVGAGSRRGRKLGDWRGVEVVNSGRMPTVIREVGIMIDWYGGSEGSRPSLSEECKLDADEPYPMTIPPTGYLLVPWPWETRTQHAPGEPYYPIRVRGYAIRGDGRRFESSEDVLSEW
jgi:hypothetical protein